MALKLANNAVSRLASPITTASTTIALTPGDGAKFPTIGAGDWFPITVVKRDGTLEIMRCTARTNDTLTVTRAQEGTSAVAFAAGDRVELRLTAAALAGASVDAATKLQTARTITIGNTGKSFDGSANVSWSLAEIGVVSASDTTQGIVELATTAEAQAGTDNTCAVTPAGIAAYAGALSFRNKLINAAFTINQRSYASGAATTSANQYTLDRWRVVTSGQNLSWTGTAPNITITAPAGGVEQVIEGIWIEGGTYTLSWTGTATATVNGSAVANGGQVTLTEGANATVRFSGGTVSKPQLERGSYATQFEHRPHGLEFALCQRYYEPLSVYQRGYADVDADMLGMAYNFRVTKRAVPTVTLNLAYANTSRGAVYDTTINGFVVRVNITGHGDVTYNGVAFASAEL